jgi:AraC-like DNA-binding protein
MAIKAFKIPPFFEVRFVDYASGCERPHTHSSLVVSAVSGGDILLQISETETCLKKGMVAAVGPNTLHCVRSYSADFAGVYVLEIFCFPENHEGFNESYLQIFGSQLFQTKESYDAFVDLCRTLLSATEDSVKLGLYVDWVHGQFVDRFDGHPPPIPESPELCQLADKIRRILDESNEESPPYDQIAQTCGYSKEHCNRVFKRTHHLSMQAYFLNKKAAKAKALLHSEKTLSEIALSCGFYDQSHLTRVFNDIYQASPRKYREAVGAGHSCTRKKRMELT